MGRRWVVSLVVLAAGLGQADPAGAQQSASFRLEEYVLNSGSVSGSAAPPASASFRLTLASIGEGSVYRAPSASGRLDVGLVSAYAPPGEVAGLASLPDKGSLAWTPERAAATYSLYRGAVSTLSGLEYGTCSQQDLVAASAVDLESPAGGQGWFYLVTAVNRLGEHGTKGFQGTAGTTGPMRTGSACP